MFDFFFPVRRKILQNMAGNGGKRVTFRSKFWDFFFWEISDKILRNRQTLHTSWVGERDYERD